MITETIVSTVDKKGQPNFAPMGVIIKEKTVRICPYKTGHTYKNLKATGRGVVNITDNVLLFAKTVAADPPLDSLATKMVPGVRLRDVCSLLEVVVTGFSEDDERGDFFCQIVNKEIINEFKGFNRAKHAVLEAAILVSRARFFSPQEIRRKIEGFREIVIKTGGEDEKTAFQILSDSIPGPEQSKPGKPKTGKGEISLRVRTPARLHFGLVNLAGHNNRIFGGLGVGIDYPGFDLELSKAVNISVEGSNSSRVKNILTSLISHYGIKGGVHVRINEEVPSHVGLGSGTQLCLALGCGVAKLYGIKALPFRISSILGRGERSGICITIFEKGGFTLDGGKKDNNKKSIPPILFHSPFPESWRFVLVTMISKGEGHVSGSRESEAFKRLFNLRSKHRAKICEYILMYLLPSIVEQDISCFGSALTRIQEMVGDQFRPIQGGRYANSFLEEIVNFMLDKGAAGAGQTSWGPTIFGIVDDMEKADLLCQRVSMELLKGRDDFKIWQTKANNHGAVFT